MMMLLRSTISQTTKGNIIATTRTPKEIAQIFQTDPKTLRKFLRKDARDQGIETPGKGSRWAIEARKVKALQKRFDAWNAARTPQSDESPNEDEVLDEAEMLDEG
jgi:transposase-like protein